MASENETVMDVCAEWRDCIEAADSTVWDDARIAGLVKTTKAQQLAYLDRIEAAWKRESDAESVFPCGDYEAMRTALMHVEAEMLRLINEGDKRVCFQPRAIAELVHNVLSQIVGKKC